MKTASISERKLVKRLSLWALLVAALLMIPLLANFPWTGSDFIFAGTVLFGAALGYELSTRNMKDSRNRLIIGAGTLFLVMLIWGLAVAD